MKVDKVYTLKGRSIPWKYKEEYEPVHRYFFDVVCPMCTKHRLLTVPSEELFKWHNNNPTGLSASELEALNTGICDTCWDSTFAIFETGCTV